MRVTVLVDNINSDNLNGEWGLSFYIEYNDKIILLDTGASDLFKTNAQKLNLKLEDVDFAVLSHAHYDHGGGMKAFFEANSKANLYVQDECKENCYKKVWFFHKYIGLPKGILDDYDSRIVYSSGRFDLCEGVSVLSHKTRGLENIGVNEGFYRKKHDGWKPDNFSHEQSLVFDTDNGLVVFNSCSHAGVVNIIGEVKKFFPDKKIVAYIGGFHTFKKSDREVKALAEQLKRTEVESIYTGHCTGQWQYEILKSVLGDRLTQFKTGLVFEL